MQVEIVKRSLLNNPHCGDECAYWERERKATLCIVDGLGHGEEAEKAAIAAIECVAGHLWQPLPEVFTFCNQALRNTRGAAMGIAVIDDEKEKLTYAGIGNTNLMIVDSHSHCDGKEKIIRLSSSYGIVGHGYRSLLPETVPLAPDDIVILSTDGLKEMIDMSGYKASLRKDVQKLGDKIMQDWRRKWDDAAVMIYRR